MKYDNFEKEALVSKIEELEQKLRNYENINVSSGLPNEDLRKLTDQLQGFLEFSPLLISEIDINGIYLNTNKATADLFNLPVSEVIGKSFHDLLTKDTAELFLKRIKTVINLKNSVTIEDTLKLEDGTREYLTTLFPLFDNSGDVSSIGSIAQDITDKNLAEKQIIDTKQFYERIIEGVQDGIWVTDENHIIFYTNIAMEKIAGISRKLIQGKNFLTDFPEETTQELIPFYNQAIKEQRPVWYEIHVKTPAGRESWQNGWLIPKYANDSFKGIICTIRDVTERKYAEINNIKAKETAERYLDMAGSIFVSLDLKGNINLVNQKGLEILEYSSSKELIGKNWFDLCIPEKNKIKVRKVFDQVVDGNIKNVEHYENEVKTKNGNLRLISWYNSIINDDADKPLFLFSSGVDVTEIRNSQERFNLAMNASRDGLFDWNLLTNEVYFSPGWKNMLGFEYEELPNELSTWERLTEPGDLKQTWIIINELKKKKRERFEIEFRMRHKDGHWVDILSRANGVFDENGNAERIIGTHVDITELKVFERAKAASEERYRSLIETASDPIYCFSENGIVVDTNQAACDMLQKSRQEILESTINTIDPRLTIESFLTSWSNMPFNVSRIIETEHLKKDGSLIPVEVSIKKYRLEEKTYFFSMARNITTRKIAENLLKNSLTEKDILLRELYHRTKNNMQVISSMLGLRAISINEPQLTEVFKDIENKILSMALVHKKLYESGDLSHIDLKEYLVELSTKLKESLTDTTHETKIDVIGENFLVIFDIAVPIGIIVNEIITNSIKYAFADTISPRINIALHHNSTDEIILNISDNGIGLPENFDIKKDSGFGLKTVMELVETQLGGQLTFKSTNGTEFKIKIKTDLYASRL